MSDQVISLTLLTDLFGLLPIEIANGAPDLHLTAAEPPLKPYAR